VEIIVGTAAGGPLDTTARLVQKIVEARNPGVPVSVQNKTGGGHAIALAYLNQFAANGHYLAMSTPNLITNRLSGSNPINYTDVTPLALLNQEYVALSVKADSPVKTGHELIERLRANPSALSFAIGFRSGNQHLAAGSVLTAAGIEVRKVKFVSFKGGAETVPAVLGGHVDVLVATPTSTLKHVQSGQLRMLGITSAQRLSGELASVPTWVEQGVNATSANWRGVVGPRGMTPQQVAYWDQFFSDMVKSAEWQQAAKKFQWEGPYLNSTQTVKFLQEEERKLARLLKELGDTK
ncbi:MAG: tripartite tricarboxylate transporter substrate binding protein, partial [Burkholderiales bacterium]